MPCGHPGWRLRSIRGYERSGCSASSTRQVLHKHRSYIDRSFASVSALTVTRLHQHGCSSFTPQ